MHTLHSDSKHTQSLLAVKYTQTSNCFGLGWIQYLQEASRGVGGYLCLASCRGESVAVCSIEKANVAINKLVQEGRLGRTPTL